MVQNMIDVTVGILRCSHCLFWLRHLFAANLVNLMACTRFDFSFYAWHNGTKNRTLFTWLSLHAVFFSSFFLSRLYHTIPNPIIKSAKAGGKFEIPLPGTTMG